ncbi:hypothetical protein AAF712_001612 [Marasmius tenuissimus]|uniref:Zn(2)-C6 fungal-type domain-containing protein n=1 Tax=Marasmius tenuissimus TaxID=585030 RepID=A0ABR3ACC8_9AGAR
MEHRYRSSNFTATHPSPSSTTTGIVADDSSPTLSASSRTESSPSVHPSLPPGYQVASRFLACFRCRGKKAKCDDVQPSCTACTKANVECVRPTGRKRKRTRKEMEDAERERARAEGRVYQGRGTNYDLQLCRGGVPTKRLRTEDLPNIQTYQHPNTYSSDEGSPASPTTNYQYAEAQQSAGTFFPPTLPEPCQPRLPLTYNTGSHPGSTQQHHIQHHVPRAAFPLVPHSQGLDHASKYRDQPPIPPLPYTQPPTVSDPSRSPSNSGLPTQEQVFHNTTTPPQLGDVVHSLKDRVAFLEGDPGESQTLKVHYYRLTGCTAIHPGFNRIVITLQSSQRPSATSSPTGSSRHSPGNESLVSSVDGLLDDISCKPPPLDTTMLDAFFSHFGEHCPFMSRDKVEERVKADTMSAFLGFAMCAVAARFNPNTTTRPSRFIDAAWKLVLPLLRLPSIDVVAGLLILSWAEFGENSESGLWNFLGLAIRMAMDLGLHKSEDSNVIPMDDVCNGKVLFWSLFVMVSLLVPVSARAAHSYVTKDRILAFGTGRAVTIPCDSVEVSALDEMDLAGRTPSSNPATPQVLSPYVQIVKLFVLAGHIANCMNNNNPTTLMRSERPVGGETLESLHHRLVEFVAQLPPSLTWSVDNFRAQAAHHRGGSFLFLHLWANAILALLHHPELGRDHTRTPPPELRRSIKLALSSSRQIVDCLVFADLFDDRSYCACPFINQCLFIAGVAFVHDAKAMEALGLEASEFSGHETMRPSQGAMAQSEFIGGLVKQNLSTILRALKKMENYWSGLGYVIGILEQRASGRGWSKVDFAATSEKSHRFISMPDMGLLRKLTEGPIRREGQHEPSHAQTVLNNVPPSAEGGVSSLSQVLQLQQYQQPPDQYQNWSFDTLLGTYRVHEVAASGLDFSSVYPGGLQW